MKKVSRIFLLFVIAFVMSACSNEVVSNNISDIQYKEINEKQDVIYNIKESITSINGVNFDLVIEIYGKEYNINGKIISNGTIENSIININYENNSLYLKDGMVYISYFYKNNNIIVKDTLDNVINEVNLLLQSKGIKIDDKIFDIVKNNTLNDIDFNGLLNYVDVTKDNYLMGSDNVKVTLNNNFLIDAIQYKNSKLNVTAMFDYGEVSIKVPLGYDIFNINLETIKELLEVNSFVELMK